MSEYYIGIMCGTSLDSLDVSLVRFKSRDLSVKSFDTYLFNAPLKRKIIRSKDLKNTFLVLRKKLIFYILMERKIKRLLIIS